MSVLGKRPAPVPSTTHYFQPTINVTTGTSSRSSHNYSSQHNNANRGWGTKRRVRKWIREPTKVGNMMLNKWKLSDNQEVQEEEVIDDAPQTQTFYALSDDRGRRRTAVPLTRGARSSIGLEAPELPPIYDRKVWVSQKKLKEREEKAAAAAAAAAAASAAGAGAVAADGSAAPAADDAASAQADQSAVSATPGGGVSSSPAVSSSPTKADELDEESSSSSSSDSDSSIEGLEDDDEAPPTPLPEEGLKPPTSPVRSETPTAGVDADDSLPAMPESNVTSATSTLEQEQADARASQQEAEVAAAVEAVEAADDEVGHSDELAIDPTTDITAAAAANDDDDINE